jgi:hypothetical protein
MADKEIITQMNELLPFDTEGEAVRRDPTVREAFEATENRKMTRAAEVATSEADIRAAGGPSRGVLKKLIYIFDQAGMSVDDVRISQINTKPFVEWLMDRMLEDTSRFTFKVRGSIGTEVKAAINISDPEKKNAITFYEEQFKNDRTNPRAFNFEESVRGTTNLAYPKFDEFNKAIHNGIMNIPDKQARAYALLRLITGIRDKDLLRIEAGMSDNLPESAFRLNPKTKTVNIFNKGTRINYNLGEFAFQILHDAQKDAVQRGDRYIFTPTIGTLRKRIQPYIRKAFADLGADIINEDTGMVKDFTLGDLRKNLFDIIDEEFGEGVANRVLGHSTKGNMGINSYKVKRQGRKELISKASDNFFGLFSNSVEIDDPKTLMNLYQLENVAENVPERFIEYDAKMNEIPPQDISPEDKPKVEAARAAAKASGNIKGAANLAEEDVTRLEKAVDRATNLQGQLDDLTGKEEAKTEDGSKVKVTEDPITTADYSDYSPEHQKELIASREKAAANTDPYSWDEHYVVEDRIDAERAAARKSGTYSKIKSGLKTVAPFIGWAGGAIGAMGVMATKEAEAAEAKARGEEVPKWKQWIRNFQAAEELISPIPTTHDAEMIAKEVKQQAKVNLPKTQKYFNTPQSQRVSPSSGFAVNKEYQAIKERLRQSEPKSNAPVSGFEDEMAQGLEAEYKGFALRSNN